MKKEPQEIKGTIKQISFRNSEGWSVFTLDTGDTCTGILADMCEVGSEVTCVGEFVVGKYGPQFKCAQIVPAPVDTNSAGGVVRLLQRLPGIGPRKAARAVSEFGPEDAWTLALYCPSEIGVKEEDCQAATEIANNLIDSLEAITYLLGIGLTDNQTDKIIKRYGGKTAIQAVSENPYRLIDEIDGFGFLTVDTIALKAGMSVGSEARVSAGVLHCLGDNEINNGHVYFYGKELIGIVLDQLSGSAKKAEVSLVGAPDYEQVRKCVYFLADEGLVEIRKGKVYSKQLLDAERIIQQSL